MSSIEYDLIIPIESINFYSSVSSYVIISCFFYPNEANLYVKHFWIYVKICSDLIFFFKLCLSLLFNMQNSEKYYEGAESEERKNPWKKSYSVEENNLVRGHSFMMSAKKSKFRTPTLFPFLKLSSMAPFYGWVSTASRLEPLRGGSLLFTTKFPEIPGTHFIDLRRMKGWVNLGATQRFYLQTSSFSLHNLLWDVLN